MIDTRTVLILGAGASVPFGFPAGVTFLRQVLWCLGQDDLWQPPHFEREKVKDFRLALRDSGTESVDAFLEHRPEFVGIGKTAMAYVLLPCEKTGSLFDIERTETNWYNELFAKMKAPKEAFGDNNVSFVTFNYDRSLEQFLFTALCKLYNLDAPACAHTLARIPITHVHGQLGLLPWQEHLPETRGPTFSRPPVLAYGQTQGIQDAIRAAESIRIISDSIDDIEQDREFSKARQLLQEADRVVFLGFRFHQQNVERLGIPNVFVHGEGRPKVFGCVYGMEEPEREFVRSRYGVRHVLTCPDRAFLRKSGCLL